MSSIIQTVFSIPGMFSEVGSAIGNIGSYISGIANEVQAAVVNTGQGIVHGFIALGGALWHGIITGLTFLGQGVMNALNWIWNSLKYLGELTWNFLNSVWDYITQAFNGFWNLLTQTFGQLASDVNNYFTGLLTGWRSKVKDMIIADITISVGWEAAKSLRKQPQLKMREDGDFALSALDMIEQSFLRVGYAAIAPVGGLITGTILASLVDSLLGQRTPNVQLIAKHTLPSFSLQPLTVIPTQVPGPVPTLGQSPTATSIPSARITTRVIPTIAAPIVLTARLSTSFLT